MAEPTDLDDPTGAHDTRRVVDAHLAAFNACDLDALMGAFAHDATFATNGELFVGARAIRSLFADSFAAPYEATLELQRAVGSGDTLACELVEHVVAGGDAHTIDLGAFYTVRRGRLVRARIYRDGSTS